MDAFSDPLIEETDVMSSGQVGKTEIINNAVGFFIHQDPSPMLVIQPTIEMGETWSKDRLSPMIRDTECLKSRVHDVRGRDSRNTILHKTFPGGHITIAGANSAASLASRPVRVLLLDEVDRFPPSAGTEGDPVSLAVKRTANFFNRKLLLTSTPTIAGVSRIETAFLQSDQRHYFVPCPRCGQFQVLLFSAKSQFANLGAGRIVFDESNLSWVYYECEACKAQLDEADKYKMIRRGRWEPQKPDVQGHAGFHINELYSPWSTWKRVVKDFLEKKQRREMLQTFVNMSLGETWNEEEAYTISEESLLSRRESYTKIPPGGLILTVGVDTQDDRLELALKAWGIGFESWLMDYRVLYGTPSDLSVWRSLDEVLLAKYETESGVKLPVECVCIDSAGHYTQEVYKYVRSTGGRRVFATVGRGGPGKPFIGKMTRNNRERARMLPIGVDDAKVTIYRRLALEMPQGGAEFPPGYMHFPDTVTESYFSMLTAEKQVIRRTKGYPVKVWEKKSASARNEALDCEVLAMAALAILNPNWIALKDRFEKMVATTPTVEEPEEVLVPASRPAITRRKNWVTKW